MERAAKHDCESGTNHTVAVMRDACSRDEDEGIICNENRTAAAEYTSTDLQKTRNGGAFAGGRVAADGGRRRQRNAREGEGSTEIGF